MISLLVWLLALVLVFGVIFYVINLLQLPSPFGQIALAIVGLIFVLLLVSVLLGEVPLRPVTIR